MPLLHSHFTLAVCLCWSKPSNDAFLSSRNSGRFFMRLAFLQEEDVCTIIERLISNPVKRTLGLRCQGLADVSHFVQAINNKGCRDSLFVPETLPAALRLRPAPKRHFVAESPPDREPR